MQTIQEVAAAAAGSGLVLLCELVCDIKWYQTNAGNGVNDVLRMQNALSPLSQTG